MKRHVLVLVALALCTVGGLTSCYTPVPGGAVVSETRPDFEGRILEVNEAETQNKEAGMFGAILVQGTMRDGTQNAQVSVAVTKDTQLWQEDGQTRRPITFEALTVGQRVQIAFRGPVAESYPMQATAGEVVVTE